jgi:hypothetical protein
MKNIITFFSVLFFGQIAITQNQPKFESLKLNSAPAFVILGVEPENIQRPTTPTEFIAGLQSSIVNRILKPNVAFELSPYYMVNPKNKNNSKRFNASDYLLNNNGNFFTTVKKSLSISLATSESDTVVYGKLNPGTALGFGMRFLLIDGKPSKELLAWNKQQIRTVFFNDLLSLIVSLPPGPVDIKLVLDNRVDNFLNISAKKLNIGLTETELKNMINKIKDDIMFDLVTNKRPLDNATLSTLFENKQKAEGDHEAALLAILNAKKNPLAKEGFMLEFAAGDATVFENNEWGNWKNAKASFWLTPSWRKDISKDGKDISLFDFMIVLRYTLNNKKDSIDVADYFDSGIKGQLIKNKWSGSVEFVGRWASDVPAIVKSKFTYRLALSADYKITDIITFKFTFGSNFDGNTSSYTNPKEMFALGGVNFGLGNLLK